MMPNWYCTALTLLVAYCLACSPAIAAASANNERVILIAAEDSWPPFSNEKGEGISSRIATAAFNHSGYQIKTIVMPYARALREAASGGVAACWNVTRQTNTEETYHFGNEPLLQAKISFYYRKDTPLNYQSIDDLADNTQVGVIIGYEYGDDYENQKSRLQPKAVSNQFNLLKMLDAKRLDVVLMFDKVFESTIKKHNLNPDDYVRGVNFYTSDIYIAFHKESNDALRYSNALDKGLIHLKESGEYDKLFNSL